MVCVAISKGGEGVDSVESLLILLLNMDDKILPIAQYQHQDWATTGDFGLLDLQKINLCPTYSDVSFSLWLIIMLLIEFSSCGQKKFSCRRIIKKQII